MTDPTPAETEAFKYLLPIIPLPDWSRRFGQLRRISRHNPVKWVNDPDRTDILAMEGAVSRMLEQQHKIRVVYDDYYKVWLWEDANEDQGSPKATRIEAIAAAVRLTKETK